MLLVSGLKMSAEKNARTRIDTGTGKGNGNRDLETGRGTGTVTGTGNAIDTTDDLEAGINTLGNKKITGVGAGIGRTGRGAVIVTGTGRGR